MKRPDSNKTMTEKYIIVDNNGSQVKAFGEFEHEKDAYRVLRKALEKTENAQMRVKKITTT